MVQSCITSHKFISDLKLVFSKSKCFVFGEYYLVLHISSKFVLSPCMGFFSRKGMETLKKLYMFGYGEIYLYLSKLCDYPSMSNHSYISHSTLWRIIKISKINAEHKQYLMWSV